MENTLQGEFTLKTKAGDIKLLFSMVYWRLLAQNGIKLEELETKLDASKGVMSMLDTLAIIIKSAGEAYSRKFKTEFTLDEDEIFELFEEDVNEEVLGELMKAMTSTRIFGKEMNQGISRAPGKKKPSKKS